MCGLIDDTDLLKAGKHGELERADIKNITASCAKYHVCYWQLYKSILLGRQRPLVQFGIWCPCRIEVGLDVLGAYARTSKLNLFKIVL